MTSRPAASGIAALAALVVLALPASPSHRPTTAWRHSVTAQAGPNRVFLPALIDDSVVGDVRAQSGARLTDRPGDAWEPHLAPSGDVLVYLARPTADDVALRLVDVVPVPDDRDAPFAGRNDRAIDLGSRFDDLDLPTFAPDGRNIVFAGLADGQWDIYRLPIADGVPADAVRIENLTATPDLDEGRPALSPDGRRLAFDFHRGSDNDDIAVMDLFTGNRVRLTDHPDVDRFPTFAPAGQTILFRSQRTGLSQIYRVSADGGGTAERVSFYPASDGYAIVAHDARTILFESDRGGQNGLYLMDSTGRNRRALLADASARFTTPRYGPDGRTVAFSAAFGDGDLGIHLMALPARDE